MYGHSKTNISTPTPGGTQTHNLWIRSLSALSIAPLRRENRPLCTSTTYHDESTTRHTCSLHTSTSNVRATSRRSQHTDSCIQKSTRSYTKLFLFPRFSLCILPTCSSRSHQRSLIVAMRPFLTHIWALKNKHLNAHPRWGLKPTTFGLEVQRAVHCATRARKIGLSAPVSHIRRVNETRHTCSLHTGASNVRATSRRSQHTDSCIQKSTRSYTKLFLFPRFHSAYSLPAPRLHIREA